MKYLLTCLALGIAFAAGAQTGFVEFPYNPDSDNDDLIGTADLLDLLSLFGSEFSEENIYLDADSTNALYYAGVVRFNGCITACSQLPGRWKVPDAEQIMKFDLNELYDYEAWISDGFSFHNSISIYDYLSVSTAGSTVGRISTNDYDYPQRCYCYNYERPKVEYDYCWVDDDNGLDFSACVNEMVSGGWYPLGGISIAGPGNLNQGAQAFWRWAE